MLVLTGEAVIGLLRWVVAHVLEISAILITASVMFGTAQP